MLPVIDCSNRTITICYIILNTCKSVRRHVFFIVYLRQKTSSDKIRKKTLGVKPVIQPIRAKNISSPF